MSKPIITIDGACFSSLDEFFMHFQVCALNGASWGTNCLVSCDHIPRRSMALFRAKAVLDELIGGLPPRSSHRLQHIA